MSFSEKPLSIALMVWKYLLQGDPFRTRVSEGRSYLSSTIWSTEIVFAPDKISALKEEASSLFRDLPDSMISVAKLHDFEAWAIQAQGAFRHQQRARELRFFIQTHAGRQARRRG